MRSFPWLAMVVALLVAALRAEAKCASEWASVSPPAEAVLPLEPHVLVTLGGVLQKVQGDTLQFEAGLTRVPAVEVVAMQGYSQRVMLVKPSKRLTPGRWTLRLGFKPVEARTPAELGSWAVADVTDSTAPALTGTPTVEDTSWRELGCGPAVAIPVKGLTADEPHVVVEAVVRTKAATFTGVFSPREGRVDLGHGMCSGGFDLPPGASATVVFTPIDLHGLRGASSAPISFTAPGPRAR